jgi:hypothetical protein
MMTLAPDRMFTSGECFLTAHHRHHHVEQHQYDLIVPRNTSTPVWPSSPTIPVSIRSNAVLAVARGNLLIVDYQNRSGCP